MYSIALILFFVYCWCLFGGLGLAFPDTIFTGTPLQRSGAILALGIAVATIVSTIGYFWGLPTNLLFIGLNLVAVAAWTRVFARHRGFGLPVDWYPVLFVMVAACLLALLPALIGGLQFTLFQGNHHDSYNYLESAITHSRFSYQELQPIDLLQIDNAGGFHYAHDNLIIRPSVVILYGTLCHFLPQQFLGNHYGFLLSMMTCGLVILAGLLQSLSPGLKSWHTLLISASVLLGFWGQYILDINSWSQLAWVPLFSFSVAFPLNQIFQPQTERSNSSSIKIWLPWWVTLIGMVYLYPEGSAFAFFPLIAMILLILTRSDLRIKLSHFAFSGAFAALLFIPVYQANIQLLIRQAGQATAAVDWWRYFQGFLGGRDGFENGVFASLADAIAGCLGLYYLTPDHNTLPALQWIWRTAYIGISILMLISLFHCSCSKTRAEALRWRAILLLGGLLILETGILCLKGQYWSAGKGLSFYAYLLLAAGLVALLKNSNGSPWSIIKRILFVPLLLSGLIMGGARVVSANQRHGILYDPPYPSIQNDLLKTTFDYADLSFLDKLHPADYVEVDIDNPWVEEFVHMQLLARGIPFYLTQPIRTNRYSDARIGQMKAERKPTVLLTVEVDQDQSRVVPSFIKFTRLPSASK